MVRKERCPQCGSKKITIVEDLKRCNTCKFEWGKREHKKGYKKEKTRFS
jgi:uncharacterized protein (DUF983 family)